jgi:superfamily II DNA or RNA helicase
MIGISATASGKSFIYYIFFNLLMHIYPEFKGLLIVPRTSLVEQMAGDFQEYAKNYCDFQQYIHRIHSGREKYTDKKITISTWQSLKGMPPEYFEPFHAVIVDEVHEATAKELPRIVNHCINSTYRVGMTGHIKDCKIAKIQLTALLGDIKTFSKSAELIEKGILAGIGITGIVLKYDDDIIKQFKGRDKVQWQDENAIIRAIPARKKFICQLTASRKGNTMVLFKTREYGRELHRLLKKNFPKKHVFYIDGTVKVDYREKVRDVTEKHEGIIIVASYGTFSTGINIKNLHNLVFAEDMLSSVKVIQSIGRLLRKYFNKNAKLYDITDDLSWKSKRNYVLKHFLSRMKYYDTEEFDYVIKNQKI